MFQDKDLHIYFSYMLYFLDNQCSIHILVDNQNMDLLGIHVNMYISHYYIEHLDHMEKDYMDQSKLELQ